MSIWLRLSPCWSESHPRDRVQRRLDSCADEPPFAFMMVNAMFAQARFLTALPFGEYTRGDEGFVQQQACAHAGIDLSGPTHTGISPHSGSLRAHYAGG